MLLLFDDIVEFREKMRNTAITTRAKHVIRRVAGDLMFGHIFFTSFLSLNQDFGNHYFMILFCAEGTTLFNFKDVQLLTGLDRSLFVLQSSIKFRKI